MAYTTFSALSFPAAASGDTSPAVAMNGALFSLGTGSFSIATFSAASQIPVGNIGLVFQASGLSLLYRASTGSVYTVNSSTSAAP